MNMNNVKILFKHGESRCSLRRSSKTPTANYISRKEKKKMRRINQFLMPSPIRLTTNVVIMTLVFKFTWFIFFLFLRKDRSTLKMVLLMNSICLQIKWLNDPFFSLSSLSYSQLILSFFLFVRIFLAFLTKRYQLVIVTKKLAYTKEHAL